MIDEFPPRPRRKRDRPEERLLAHVKQAAKVYGYLAYHTRWSFGSDPGFPDLILASADRCRLLAIEVKSPVGRLSEPQLDWLNTLRACGVECHVWRPKDLDEIHRVLGGRGERVNGGAS